ncbi:MAG: aminotransferase class III-fold pyridoxal phosphate-dependent enzyme [Deltaproteobacteria bacterium]|nr:aminotransferase class III-fold pyridoxal phosphate-dependent enzyme [Deltaproteobacteria bacterium]
MHSARAMSHRYPESAVFYRALDRALPMIVRGEGVWLVDEHGRRYLDACGGAYVANLGHGVSVVADAVAEQIKRVAYVNGTAFTNEPVEALAAELRALAPRGLGFSYFLSSGSEAVEAALKLARQHHVESGRPGKHKLIARTPGYHGNTLLALSASAREHYKKMYGPWLVPVRMIGAPYPYRVPADDPAMTGEALEAAILAEGPDSVAAFIAEPIGGSSTGGSVPPAGYWQTIREICDRYDVLLIADEVLTGAGRTGRWLASEHFGLVPDIITMGKGLSGGFVPLSAVLASERVIAPIAAGSGALKHAQTFSHTPAICAAGLAAVRHIREHDLVARAAAMGEILHARLAPLRDLAGVGDVRGKGLLAGIELVADKDTKAPFPRAAKVAERLVANALDRGLVLWPNVGHADGERGDLVMVAPPFIISEDEIDQLVSRLAESIEATLSTG